MKTLLAAILLALCAAAPAADFTPLDRGAARALLAHRDTAQPTVVALWASDCSYCKQNLRTLAGLARTHPRLRIVTVAAERPSALTQPELDKTGVPGERYAYADDVPEALAYAIDPNWRGELPRTYLFDARGGVQAVSGTIDAAGFRTALKLK